MLRGDHLARDMLVGAITASTVIEDGVEEAGREHRSFFARLVLLLDSLSETSLQRSLEYISKVWSSQNRALLCKLAGRVVLLKQSRVQECPLEDKEVVVALMDEPEEFCDNGQNTRVCPSKNIE